MIAFDSVSLSQTLHVVQVRTLRLSDVQNNRGAPNVDGGGGPQRLKWFHSMSRGADVTAQDAIATQRLQQS
jgi:hypothetical protein